MLNFSTQQEIIMEGNGGEKGEVLQRGRLYERYSEKRDAKLREEWFLRMEEKEADMWAMWDRFERARDLSSRQEKSRPSDVRSDSHTGQKITKSIHEEKKTKTTAAPRNNSTKKSTNFSMPLTTKENRAPISNANLTISSLSRSNTINEEQRKGKPVQSHHHRRNTLAEFRGLALDQNCYSDYSTPRNTKPFLKKGSGIGAGAGAAIIAKQRRSIGNEQRDTDSSSTSLSCSGSESMATDNLVRERKKWGTPEKPLIFSGESLKDGTRGLKKLLLNIVGKTKTRDISA